MPSYLSPNTRWLLGVKITVAAGFAVLTGGLITGATTSTSSGAGFAAAWLAVAGAGMGLVLMTAAATALSQVSAERSGTGAAMLQALRNVGAPLGAAVLGSVVNAAYLARLRLPPLPAPLAEGARNSIFGAVSVAGRVGSPSLLASARAAFVEGMAQALAVSAGIAMAGMVLALVFLPGRITTGAGKPRRTEGGIPRASGSPAAGPGVA